MATTWRGVTVCECMVAPLNELAKRTGSDFYVKPIPGFGSYQSGSTASGSTATGGGHIDIYLTGYTATKKKQVESLARQIGFYADIREPKWYSKYFGRWLSANWASHLHMLLKDCVHLSEGAKAQLAEWYNGENGLVGHDLDDGDRTFLRQTYRQFMAAVTGVAQVIVQAASRKVDYSYPYGSFKVPGQKGSLYGPSTRGKPWYSGRTAGGKNEGVNASGYLSLRWIRGHIRRIQKIVGTTQDGIYGPITVARVKRWQSQHNCAVDGLVGPQTWVAMAKRMGQ